MKRQVLAIAALCLTASSVVFAQNSGNEPQGSGSSNPPTAYANLLKEFSYQEPVPGVDKYASQIAFDRKIVYVTSPDLTVMSTPSLTPQSTLSVIFQPESRAINRISVFDHTLYVMTSPRFYFPDHVMFQSTDRGNSFQAIDEALETCPNGSCRYMDSTEMLVRNGLMYVNAGGGKNLLVSNDDAESFDALSGGLYEWACYHPTFDITGRTVLFGGECSIDFVFLEAGRLSKDGLSMEVPLQPVNTPDLSNRKINYIESIPGTSIKLVGAEGALLRSVDGGQNFDFVFNYTTGDGYYPYIENILVPRQSQNFLFISGWDKAGIGTPYLAYGTRDGSQWTDISYVFSNIKQGIVTDLAEDKAGRIIAVVQNVTNKTISIYQVVAPTSVANP